MSIYNINKKPQIPVHIENIMKDSARSGIDTNMDYTEAISLLHCDLNIKDSKTYFSEKEFQIHYNKTLGSSNHGWSIPDGVIVNNNTEHLLSVFRVSNLVIEQYICRKFEKIIQVAKSEYNRNTSLYYNKFPNNEIEKINIHIYIFVPHITNINKIRNVIKKIHRLISDQIPDFINMIYNIFQTFDEIEKSIWYGSNGICFYLNPKPCKTTKFKTIKDIRNILILIEKINIDYSVELSETFFIEL